MKKLLLAACTLLFIACNENKEGAATSSTDSTGNVTATATSADNLDFPYTIARGHKGWQNGDPKHAVNAQKALKAYESNNMSEMGQYFADSVEIAFDNWQTKLSRDSLQTMFGRNRNDMAAFNVRMEDWESVKSKDGKEEWVTLWYVQTWTDKKGKTDSMSVINDVKFVNGKIAILDEALRHFQAKK